MQLKPREIANKKINAIIALSVFLFTAIIYMLTQARSISFWDAGEYITCSGLLGVPHPPGNPFYIMLGRFLTLCGSFVHTALVINFISVLFGSLATMFTYLITVKIISMFEDNQYYLYLGGIIAALYTGFSATFWTNSIEAEVLSGLAFIINFAVWLTYYWREKADDFSHQNILLLIIYILFLGFGIHQTALQVAPGILILAMYPMIKDNIKKSSFWIISLIVSAILLISYYEAIQIAQAIHIPDLGKMVFAGLFLITLIIILRKKVSLKIWGWGLFLIGIAFSTHIFLLIRSELRPFINEGYPHNYKLFMDYILRRQYGLVSFTVRRASFLYQMKDQFLTYFSWQFFEPLTLSKWTGISEGLIRFFSNIFVFGLGLFGMIFHAKKNKHSFIYWLVFFLWVSVGMVYIINLSDKEVRDRDYFFVTAYNFWTIWMAIGSIGIIKLIAKNSKKMVYIASVIALIFPVVNLASQYWVHDRSREFIALDYGTNILNSLEEDAIIFTNGDNDTFPVWYAQGIFDPHAKEFVHPKRDVSPDENCLEAKVKAMEFKNNNCFGIRRDVSVANFSLLNTPWYIQQLRDREGIEFDWKNDVIENIQPQVVYNKTITNSDIISWKRLFLKLSQPQNEDERYIKNNLTEEAKTIVNNWEMATTPSEQEKKIVLSSLNRLLKTPLDYYKFQKYKPKNGVFYLLNKIESREITRDELIGLNRILLESILKGIINNKRYFEFTGKTPDDKIVISFETGEILWVKDIATLRIIKQNYGKRPIYFAVTVSDRVGFDAYLRNEGMVDRLVSTKGNYQIDEKRLKKNIEEVYSYRGIHDSTLYKDKNMRRLLNNYGAPYMRISQYYLRQNNYDDAVKYMEQGLTFYEEPESWYSSLIQLYIDAAVNKIYEEKFEEAFQFLERGFKYVYDDPEYADILFNIAEKYNQKKLGIEYLNKLKAYDSDKNHIDSLIKKLQS